MQAIFIDATWDKDIFLRDDVINYLKENQVKSVALFASVQFLNLKNVIKQLKDLNIDVKTTKAKRTDKEMQILGCDAYHDSFNDDIIENTDVTLYVGDGMFHPKALLLSQIHKKTIKEVLIWDPVNEEMKIITEDDIKEQIRKIKANLKLYINAKTIGIIVTMKPGQQYLNNAKKLKEQLEKQDKKAFIFIDNTIDINHFENYPFVDVWVNTACPRIGFDDITTINKPLINIRDAYDPVKTLESLYGQ